MSCVDDNSNYIFLSYWFLWIPCISTDLCNDDNSINEPMVIQFVDTYVVCLTMSKKSHVLQEIQNFPPLSKKCPPPPTVIRLIYFSLYHAPVCIILLFALATRCVTIYFGSSFQDTVKKILLHTITGISPCIMRTNNDHKKVLNGFTSSQTVNTNTARHISGDKQMAADTWIRGYVIQLIREHVGHRQTLHYLEMNRGWFRHRIIGTSYVTLDTHKLCRNYSW